MLPCTRPVAVATAAAAPVEAHGPLAVQEPPGGKYQFFLWLPPLRGDSRNVSDGFAKSCQVPLESWTIRSQHVTR